MNSQLLKSILTSTLTKGSFIPVYPQQPPLSSLLKSQEEVFDSALTIEDLTLLRLRTDILYYLYARPLNGLTKLKSILNLILLPPLTASKYGKVTNRKPYLYRASANSNTPLCLLAYVTAQAASKAILIIPYRITLTTSTPRTWMIYLFIAITLLSILSTFERSYSALETQDFILI